MGNRRTGNRAKMEKKKEKQNKKNMADKWKMTGGFLALWAYQAVYCLKPLQSLDELWVFNMGLQMAVGGKPYEDFSSVLTPVSFLLSGAVLWVFGQELLVLRILGAVVSAGICFMFYLILRRNTEDRPATLIFTSMFAMDYGRKITYDYNWLLLLETMILLYFMLCRENSARWRSGESLAVGVLGGIAFLTKQSTGLCVMTAALAVCCLEGRKRRDGRFGKALMGSGLVVGGCLLWLKGMGVTDEFWDYCFGGLGSFARENGIGLGEYLRQGSFFPFWNWGLWLW